MPEHAYGWIVAQIGSGAKVMAARSLHGGESPWWIDLMTSGGSAVTVVFRSLSSRINPEMIATNAAALAIAEQYDLPAPRLLGADLTGQSVGAPATLETVVPGTGWPVECSAELLRAAGAAMARVHAIRMKPSPVLPFRPRPIVIDDFATERRLGRMPTTPLLTHADERLRAEPVPTAVSDVFVHGDLWPGNTVVAGKSVRGLIDWKLAGVGSPGVDLGELRKQVAIVYGQDAPRFVLEGWERATDTRALDISYWDATAALNTSTEYNGRESAARRDEFLSRAIAQL